MCKDTQGILPKFKGLKESFIELVQEVEPILEKTESNEHMEHIKGKMLRIYGKLKELPDELNQSYEMIQKVIHSIHSSRSELKKSVDGLIKKTGVQLRKITSTTEEATNKIMDVAENLDEEQINIINLVEKLESSLNGENADILSQIKEKLHQNQDAAFEIIDFLQFQDITAQQIAGAYSLLADTEATLIQVSNMLMKFDIQSGLDKSAISQSSVDKNSFNADANFTDKSSVQTAIDDIFNTGSTDVDVPENKEENLADLPAYSKPSENAVDNSSIDDLFAQNNKKEKAPEEDFDIDSLFADNKPSKPSEDDINALFENNQKEEETKESKETKEESNVSQDDIDALFS